MYRNYDFRYKYYLLQISLTNYLYEGQVISMEICFWVLMEILTRIPTDLESQGILFSF